ncbi:hypothetical protein MMC14_006369 [Varicellaria rhodocarpa]|nr:hypothetical protein [Varicellaria rhodocarpa]
MSSIRNAIQRPTHKERAQPKDREKWGILEKHKDYSLRAKDYNEKKKRLKILREKAAERNPDEFHFGMMSSRQKLTDRGNKSLSMDAVKLLKTQDAGYLRAIAQQTRKARERLEQGVILGHGKHMRQNISFVEESRNSKDPQHVKFVETKEQQDNFELMKAFKSSSKISLPPKPRTEESDNQYLEGDEEEIEAEDQVFNERPPTKKNIEARSEFSRINSALRKRRKREQVSRKARLEGLKVREREIMAAERELELQRAKMRSSAGGVTKAGVKWKVRERKR